MPNITTNHAITYTNYRWKGVSHRGTFFHLKHFAKSEFFGLGYFTKSILGDKVNVFGESQEPT